MRASAGQAEIQRNHWLAFQMLRKALGDSSYRSTIRNALQPAATVPCPKAYRYVWQLKPAGVVNLNLDRLVTKALGEVSPGRLPAEFSGRHVESYLHSLKSPHPFIANLHGVADDASSWVFTEADLKKLFKSAGYRTFITGCLAATTTLFLGVSADDVATGGHLASLARTGIDTGDHYWLTNRNDIETDKWAEQAGIHVIRYREHNEHAEVLEFFEDIIHFVPDDGPSPPPVLLEHPTPATSLLPSAEQLLQLDDEEIREILNNHAKGLLGVQSVESYGAYNKFAKAYDRAIYRAWYTSVAPPGNRLLGFTLVKEVARGAFGRVYRATAPDGREVAIKVLLEDIRRDPQLLASFRRGVRSMRFLRSRNVDGMVAYREASEIPAFVVMDWVDGPTLSQALEARQIDDWDSVLKIAIEMTSVIRRAHAIPERVLHRDLRPSNIMFDGFYSRPDDWRVVVLDFDLSWHTGAHEKSVIYGAITGYLAPEQMQATPSVSTRHAAVDSFGVGMTLYYLISGTDPMPAQHRHRDWAKDVTQAATRRAKGEWVSLAYRYARLVIRATQDRQAERWDIAQINDELGRLRAALASPERVVSAELLAEEIAARCGRDYKWDDETATATMQLPSGLTIRIAGDESDRLVLLRLNWSSSGQEERKQVGKWLAPATERCVGLLTKSGWRIRTRNVQAPRSVALEATLLTTSAASSLSSVAEIISLVAEKMTFR